MAQLRIDAAEFSLNSKFKCCTECEWRYTDDTHTEYTYNETSFVEEYGSTERKVVIFDLAELPAGATVKQATVYATLGSPLYGVEVSTINGVGVGISGGKSVPVTIEEGATSVRVEFVYKCTAVAHNHASDGYHVNGGDYWDGNTLIHHLYKDHESVVGYTDVYLLIEYDGGEESAEGGVIYRAEGGELVPYRLYRAEGGELVPYRLHHAEGGELVPY